MATQVRKEGYSKFFVIQNSTEEKQSASVLSTSRVGLTEEVSDDDDSNINDNDDDSNNNK